jgi:hypothetical protein
MYIVLETVNLPGLGKGICRGVHGQDLVLAFVSSIACIKLKKTRKDRQFIFVDA